MTATPALDLWINRLCLRSTLSEADKDAIRALPCHYEAIPAHRDFVRLGERIDQSCLVVSGWAGRFGQTRGGLRQITAVHLAGDMADLHSLLLPDATNALMSLSAIEIVRIPHAALRAVLTGHPRIFEAAWRDCEIDAGIISQWAVTLGRLGAATRLAHLLCELALRAAVAKGHEGPDFELPINQNYLADIAGLTSVHVNRTLRDLRERGLVAVAQKRVRVLDWAGLKKFGEFDSGYLHLGIERPW